ncbi:MAG: hypothetical protein A2W22_02860 [Candidatus Levybacteria bacterium RBG_16_35_11]|nr:MAG: hypothetical protein A2W22_02860 [Candidatus Levybacteria bacterium RBG_16_35_11]
MSERLNPKASRNIEQKIKSRRKNVALALIVAGFLGAEVGIKVLVEGGGRLLSPVISAIEKDYTKLTDPSDASAYIGTEKFLISNLTYDWFHRSGNTIEDIDAAFKEGARIFDIDLSCINEELYGEHGFIFRENILGTSYVVFDPNEWELKRGLPQTFKDLIGHIASLDTPERPLAVTIGFKYGNFTEEVLEKMVNILIESKVPAIIQPIKKDRLDYIRKIYKEKTGLSGTSPRGVEHPPL